MWIDAPITCRFIARLRRRMWLMRIAESMAVCLLAASLAGVALTPILKWRGEPVFALVAGLLGVGMIVGLAWGMTRRPTALNAALEADRQLRLHDLLATVWQLPQAESSPQWNRTLLAMSEARCRQLTPSAVIVARLGAGTWGGAAVAALVLVGLSVAPLRPADLRAAAPVNAGSDNPFIAAPQIMTQAVCTIPDGRPAGGGGADDLSSRRFAQDQPDDQGNESQQRVAGQQNASAAGHSGSIGGGFAQTAVHSLPSQAFFGTGLAGQQGNTATGGGAAEARAGASGAAGTGAVAPADAGPTAIKPWQANGFGADEGKIADPARMSVPDAEADLVRDYFQRD